MDENLSPNLTLDDAPAPTLTLEAEAPAAPSLSLDAAAEEKKADRSAPKEGEPVIPVS